MKPFLETPLTQGVGKVFQLEQRGPFSSVPNVGPAPWEPSEAGVGGRAGLLCGSLGLLSTQLPGTRAWQTGYKYP